MAADDIQVPPIGPAPRVLLSRWLVPDGATVALNDPICELETDKATVDLPAHRTGTLVHIAREGEYVRPGDPIGTITPHRH